MTTKFHPAAQKAYDAARQRRLRNAHTRARRELCNACEDYVLHWDNERVDPETEQALLNATEVLRTLKEELNAE